MGKVRNRTNAALRAYAYDDAGTEQLKRELRRVEKDVAGANPHNIGMATFEFVSSHSEETEREIKRVLAEAFPNHKLPGTFPEEWDGS